MKHILPLFVVALLFMAGCNSSQTKSGEDKTAAPVFKPYNARLVELTRADYDKWYAGFKSHDSLMKAYGITYPAIAREMDSTNKIIVFTSVADVQKAKTF